MSANIRLSLSSAARLSVVPDGVFAQSGTDVPQLYVALPGAGGLVPRLAGFDHIDLAASTFAARARRVQADRVHARAATSIALRDFYPQLKETKP